MNSEPNKANAKHKVEDLARVIQERLPEHGQQALNALLKEGESIDNEALEALKGVIWDKFDATIRIVQHRCQIEGQNQVPDHYFDESLNIGYDLAKSLAKIDNVEIPKEKHLWITAMFQQIQEKMMQQNREILTQTETREGIDWPIIGIHATTVATSAILSFWAALVLDKHFEDLEELWGGAFIYVSPLVVFFGALGIIALFLYYRNKRMKN
ncbi:MAG: hypothetical protein ACE5OZ_14035 [Candidatus Heimdallarchaeota archaeon]